MSMFRLLIVRSLLVALLMPALSSTAIAQKRQRLPFEEDSELIQKRSEYFYRQRAFPFDRIPVGARLRALDQVDQIDADQSRLQPGVTKPKWRQFGPEPINPAQGTAWGGSPSDSGRVSALATDRTNPNVAYLGAAEGGVWKTTDAGAHWVPLTDNQPSLAIGNIAIDPTNSQTIYAGTGEANFNGDAYYGAGILKSTNGGETWTQLTGGYRGSFGICKSGSGSLSSLFAGAYIGAIGVNPGNNMILLAGVANCPSDGVFRSTDGGKTWVNVLSGAPGSSVFFVSSTVAYAALGAISGNSANGIYISTDAGATWSADNGTGSSIVPSGDNVGRITLVAAPSSPSSLYVALQSPSPIFGAFGGLYKTVDGGAHWIQLGSVPDFCSSPPNYNFCWYDMALAVSPVDPDVIYAGGIYDYDNNSQTTLVASIDGGNTWTLVGASNGGGRAEVHTDSHAIAFTADGSRLLVGSDGGVWGTTHPEIPSHVNWTGLNATLATAQFYPGFALDAKNASAGIGGTQDNGSVFFSGYLKWSSVTCGDGGFSAIDPTTYPSTYYAACTYSQGINKSTNPSSPASWSAADRGIAFTDPGLFIPPMVMNPSDPGTLYYGTNRVYQTTNGGISWAPISPQPLPPNGGVISAIAPSPADAQTVYEGASDGTVAVTTSGGQTWNDRSVGLPTRYVTHITADPSSATVAYVTYSGFSGFNADHQGHVFSTVNGGINWTDISGNLPNIPVNDLLIDPNASGTLYVATDIGVFWTNNSGASWGVLGTGLPKVAVLSLTMQQGTGTLVAATHGRSVWSLGLGKFKVLYSFSGQDGSGPYGGLIQDASGILYGTTSYGGAYNQGTVFKLDHDKDTVLYSFLEIPDGENPQASLVQDATGNLYGTTANGGGTVNSYCTVGCGTVFELDSSGNEVILHSFNFDFPTGTDGAHVFAGLVRDSQGNLYGTTFGGGAYDGGCCYGVVFKVDQSGTESVLYPFIIGGGAYPYGGLVRDGAGNLYGTTTEGGPVGDGNVFELDATGKESVLYNFTGAPDGAFPYATLLRDGAGNLYGTTAYGGTGTACTYSVRGCGTVFKLDTTGHESVLHTFTGTGGDGAIPFAGLVQDAAGDLYGTTASGGTGTCSFAGVATGCGTIFKLDSAGNETVLHRFTGYADGAHPYAGLLQDALGNLYGTAPDGGPSGNGVLFELAP